MEGLGEAPLYALYAYSRQELITRRWVDDPFLVSQIAGSSELVTVSPAVEVSVEVAVCSTVLGLGFSLGGYGGP